MSNLNLRHDRVRGRRTTIPSWPRPWHESDPWESHSSALQALEHPAWGPLPELSVRQQLPEQVQQRQLALPRREFYPAVNHRQLQAQQV